MTEYIQNNHFESQKPIGKPSVITWQGVRMLRSHSIQAVSKEIINMSANQEMVSVNAIGKQSTGKTELLKTVSHLIHKHSKIPYQISYFGKEEMLNLEETVSKLNPISQILIFDDIAFLKASATNKQIDQIQQVLSIIRHLPGGKDVKIILMKSFQYTKAIPPFLRQNDFTFVSSVDDNEIDNLTVLLGKKYYSKIKQLKFLRAQGAMGEEGKSTFTFDMGGGKKVIYRWQNPFLPFIYVSGVGCRIICSPLRQWIDPVCNVCAKVNNEPRDKIGDVKQVVEDFISKFKDGNTIKTAVKIKLIQQGINAFSPRIVQAVKYIERMQQEKLVSIESLASELKLTPTKTLLFPDKQPEVKP